jgi:hypothetical protein
VYIYQGRTRSTLSFRRTFIYTGVPILAAYGVHVVLISTAYGVHSYILVYQRRTAYTHIYWCIYTSGVRRTLIYTDVSIPTAYGVHVVLLLSVVLIIQTKYLYWCRNSLYQAIQQYFLHSVLCIQLYPIFRCTCSLHCTHYIQYLFWILTLLVLCPL